MEDKTNNKIEENKKELNKLIEGIQVWDPKEYLEECLKKWHSFTMIISGSRMSGKSNLLKHLLSFTKKRFDIIVVFSRTLINGFYQSFIDSKLIFDDYKPEVLIDLRKTALNLKEQGKKFKYLLIFDDCVDSKSKYEKEITNSFFNGRHYGESLIFLTQKCSLLSTGWMSNCLIHITLFAGSRSEKEYLAEKIITDAIDGRGLSHKSKKEVERYAYLLQTEICHDYEALIILPYHHIKIYRYKAPLMKDKKKKAKSIYEELMTKNSK